MKDRSKIVLHHVTIETKSTTDTVNLYSKNDKNQTNDKLVEPKI